MYLNIYFKTLKKIEGFFLCPPIPFFYNPNINFPNAKTPFEAQFIAGVIIVPAIPVIQINTNTI